jgi:subtilisin-like proprotein convertase family protein
MLAFVRSAFLLLGALTLAPVSLLRAELGLQRDAYGVWDRAGGHPVEQYPYVRGQEYAAEWTAINPARNNFDWTALDSLLQVAYDQNQRFFVKIQPVSATTMPPWIFAAGVPEIVCPTYTYGFYLDPEFKIYFEEMVQALGKHLREEIPAHLANNVSFVRVDTGATGDEEPYEGSDVSSVPAQYQISANDWRDYRLWAFSVYDQAFQHGTGPQIPLLFQNIEVPAYQTELDWVMTNVTSGFGAKYGGQVRGHHLSESRNVPDSFKALSMDTPFRFFSANEMDQTWQKPYFQLNLKLGMYWCAVEQLNAGMTIWDWSGSVMEGAAVNDIVSSAEFFNTWAAELDPPTARGGFCIFHEGLASDDTTKFPTATYGSPATKANTARYTAICTAYASQGAKMDDLNAATLGQVAQRKDQIGFNDAGWEIWPGNYERFITQMNPDSTSKGLWRVNGTLTTSSHPYDRFARRFDSASGRNTMYFDINDNLLPSVGQRVRLSVDYLDRGTGQFALQYDAVGNDQKNAFTVTKTGSNTWKTASAIVTDWAFRNQGPNGSDLILVNLDSDDDIFHKLEVTKLANVQIGTVGVGTVSGRTDATTYAPVNGEDFAEGQRLELQATAGPGWVFTGWSGALTGSNPRPFLFPTEDTSLTATFALASVSSSVDDFNSVTWSGGTGWSADWTASSTLKPGAFIELYGGSPIPQITRTLAAPLTSATLSFAWDLDRTTRPGSVEVFDGTWHTVWTQTEKGTDSGGTVDLVPATINLSSYGAISQIRFTLDSNTSTDRLSIDDVSVTGVPSATVYPSPQFSSDPISKTSATSGTAYTGQTLAGNATDPNSQPLTFIKLSKISGGTDWLTVSPSGALSGTPTSADAGLNRWTVQVGSNGGSDTATLLIDVSAPGPYPPTALTYSFPSAYTKGTAIANLLPTSSGGIVMRYVASPDLPKGLYLNSTTGSISGTPIEVTATATYAITATNADGSTTTTYTITVNDVAPSALTYSSNPAAYTSGVAIPSNTPTNSGGGVMLYAVSPALPAGLTLNTSTGVISGTPLATSPMTLYTVTAANSGGSTTAQVSITVTGFAPTSLSYFSNPAIYTKGTAITQNVPASSGGAAASYSVTPALPSGLTLDPTTGVISGTPTTVTPSASYTITAANTNGSTTAPVSITVNDTPPSLLEYSNNPAVFTVSTQLVNATRNSPTSSGGAVVSYSITPALPAGITLNSQGETRGTPTAASPTTVYTVTATNSGGSTTALLTITVNNASATSPPENLTYSTNPATYTKGTAITNNSPSSTGGAVLSYSVTPALPAGLALNTSSGIISGTPTTVTSAANYIVTATNSSGFTTASVNITVNDVAPSALTYSNNPVIYTKGMAITANTPTSSGGAMTSYVVSPALPAGVALNPSTGVISGTPTAASPTTVYTVTATNSGGSTTALLAITVNDFLTYSNSSAITINDRAAATPYPSSIIVPATTGTVTKVTVSLIGFNHSYPGDVDILLVGPSGKKLLLMSDAGGATDVVNANIVFTDTASSSLPNSLISSGTYKPTNYDTNSDTFPSPAPASPYVATLSTFNTINPTGTWSLYVRDDSQQDPGSINGGWSLSFEITPPPPVTPSSLAYASSPVTYTKGTAIAVNTPTSSGGAVTSYAVSPALPVGLTLNPSTGVISGTPTVATPTASYTVTATNSGGSTNVMMSITVNDAAPTALAYLINPAIYIQGSAITANNPTSSGGVVLSYAILPALPAGLTLNPLTGVISGTPSEVTPAASYSATATNTGGSTSTLLSITVVSPYTAWATPYNLVQDLNGDDDGDGNSNYFEFIAGLVPTNAGSVFKISVSSVPGQPSHRAIVISPIISGRTYTVKSSESLQPATWIPLSGSTSSDNGNERTVTDTEATEAKKFYMIEISTP